MGIRLKSVSITFWIGVAIWLLDALAHHFILSPGHSFPELLFNIPGQHGVYTLFYRLLILLILVISGWIIGTLRERQEQTRTQLETSLLAQESLLREVHHRVKNNLAIISSLTRLQTDSTTNKEESNKLQQLIKRIDSIALVHKNIYKNKTLTSIRMDQYFNELVTHILSLSKNKNPVPVDIESNLAPVYLDLDSAIPLGLIVNELVSNACQHAFQNRSRGTIAIEFSGDSRNFLLKISDNGTGFAYINTHSFAGLGLKMVEILAKQLHARLTIESGEGQEGSQISISRQDNR